MPSIHDNPHWAHLARLLRSAMADAVEGMPYDGTDGAELLGTVLADCSRLLLLRAAACRARLEGFGQAALNREDEARAVLLHGLPDELRW